MKRSVFGCAECGRVQGYAPKGEPGGVDEEEAKAIGWTRREDGWHCPFCSGPESEAKLRRVFEKSRPPPVVVTPAYLPSPTGRKCRCGEDELDHERFGLVCRSGHRTDCGCPDHGQERRCPELRGRMN